MNEKTKKSHDTKIKCSKCGLELPFYAEKWFEEGNKIYCWSCQRDLEKGFFQKFK
jgi:formylmethanofuran dehydrogenase subunit E